MNDNLLEIVEFSDNYTDSARGEFHNFIENKIIFSDAEVAMDACDTEAFYVAMKYPIDKFMDGFLEAKSSNKYEIFLYKHSEFIETHFEKAIKLVDGSMCINDKSKTIMVSLAKFFKNNAEIIFNRDQDFTYHLPERIFVTHEEILSYFVALYELYYGNPNEYILFYKDKIDNNF